MITIDQLCTDIENDGYPASETAHTIRERYPNHKLVPIVEGESLEDKLIIEYIVATEAEPF